MCRSFAKTKPISCPGNVVEHLITKELGGQPKWGNLEESPGKEVEMVWACDGKKGGLCRKESDGKRSAKVEEA